VAEPFDRARLNDQQVVRVREHALDPHPLAERVLGADGVRDVDPGAPLLNREAIVEGTARHRDRPHQTDRAPDLGLARFGDVTIQDPEVTKVLDRNARCHEVLDRVAGGAQRIEGRRRIDDSGFLRILNRRCVHTCSDLLDAISLELLALAA